MKRMRRKFLLFFLICLVGFSVSFHAIAPEDVMKQAEAGVGYDVFLDSLPKESVEFLSSSGVDLSSEGEVPGLAVIVGLIYKSVLTVVMENVSLISIGILLLFVLKLLSAVSAKEEGVSDSLAYLAVITSGVYSFSVIETMLGALVRVTTQSASFLTAALPAIVSARLWSGGDAGAATLSVTLPVVFTAVSALVSSLFYPLCLFCYAASLCGFFQGGITLRPFVSSVKKFCTRGIEIISGLSVGVFCVQRLAAASADTLARRGVRFALVQMLPVAGSALTDGIETVYACGRSLCGKMGVVCVLVLFGIFAVPCILGFVLVSIYSLLSTLGQVLEVPLLSGFFSDVKDTFAMMTCFAVCSLVVLSAALLLLTGG